MVLGFISLTFSVNAAGSKVSLAPLTQELSDGFKTKVGDKKWRLAILDFSADKDLTAAEVPALLDEMVTYEFVKKPEFIVLERELFDKVLEEHKLQASFGDMETAVKVGRVLGAQAVFVGRANRIGDQVRISGRLVNCETTEILSTAVQDVPMSAFSKKNNPAPGPTTSFNRTFGFSALYSLQSRGSNQPVSQTFNSGAGNATETLKYERPEPNWIGAKLSYFFAGSFFGGFSYQVEARHQALGQVDLDSAAGTRTSYDVRAQGRLIRGEIGYVKALSPMWETTYSGGFGSLKYDPMAAGYGIDAEVDKTFPFVGFGIAFFPESRLSVGINLTYDIGTFEGKFKKNSQTAFKLDPFNVGPTVTFYF